MRDFVLFDGGMKKLPRVHQHFGIKAAQALVQQRRGGIIWHTQGAGKSILMVLLAEAKLFVFVDECHRTQGGRPSTSSSATPRTWTSGSRPRPGA